MYVQKCDGKFCNDKGDDFIEDIADYRFENCDSDNGDEEDVCNGCRSAGRAAGALCALALVFIVAAIGLNGARFAADSTAIKYTTVAMNFCTMVIAFLALVVWGVECYDEARDKFLEGDVYADNNNFAALNFDTDEIRWSLGPGSIVLITAMLLQPVSVFLLVMAPAQEEDPSAGNGGPTAVPAEDNM